MVNLRYDLVVTVYLGFLVVSYSLTATQSSHLARLVIPDGFVASYFAAEVPFARSLTQSRQKDGGTIVYVSTKEDSKVYALPDLNDDGVADSVRVVVDGLDTPNGIAVRNGDLYVAEIKSIWRYGGADAAVLAQSSFPSASLVTDIFPDEPWHGWKYMAFGPEGYLYVPLGAPCNTCTTTMHGSLEFSAIHVIDVDRGELVATVARGVRNTVGFDWHPITGEFWFTDNGRDWFGDNLPDCELNRVSETDMKAALTEHQSPFYGFPQCHSDGGSLGDPYLRDRGGGSRVADDKYNDGVDCNSADGGLEAVQVLGPHTAPLGMRFYRRNPAAPFAFPAEWDNVALIANHGSWNRGNKIGYNVVAVSLDSSNAATKHTNFLQGLLVGQKAHGRPVDVLQLHDGSLLVSDDKAGCIYRIAYNTTEASTTTEAGTTTTLANLGNSGSLTNVANTCAVISSLPAALVAAVLALTWRSSEQWV